MGQPIRLTDNQAAVDWAKGVVYNAAGQMTQMSYTLNTGGTAYRTETRQYNALGQTTQLSAPGLLGYQYTYSATQNNGQITQRTDLVSGEVVNYQYDELKRLIAAETAGPEWGQSFGYDGFGNLLSQTVTKGSAPSLYVNVGPATNLITTGGYLYDVENRLVQATPGPAR
jgi:YD repeat-containing protein